MSDVIFSVYHVRSLRSVYLVINVIKDKEKLKTRLNRPKIPDEHTHIFKVVLRNILNITGE